MCVQLLRCTKCLEDKHMHMQQNLYNTYGEGLAGLGDTLVKDR